MNVKEERCDLTDLLMGQCAHCQGHHDPVVEATKPRQYPVDTERSPITFAAFPSECPTCGELIHVGDVITRIGAFWVCTECGA